MIKKITIIFGLLVIIFGGALLPTKRSGAFIGSIISAVAERVAPQQVVDPTHIAANGASWAQTFANRLADQAEKFALATLKKRVLDQIVNQTISWINGDGDPQFVTDWRGFLENAGDRAVGDVLREINLGSMCEPFRLRVRFDLENTYFGESPFNSQSSCSLSRVVDNIENFYSDFSRGGWIGYTEMLRPQNNYYGAYLIAEDEAIRRTSVAVDVSGREAAAGDGFLNTKRCYEWRAVVIGPSNSGSLVASNQDVRRSSNNDFPYYDPTVSPPGGVYDGAIVDQSDWICSNSRTVTPGQLLVGATSRAINANTDYIINADTLQEYAAAIIDAGINRLIREGVDGFQGILTDASSPEYSTQYGTGAVNPETEEAGRGYTNTGAGQTQNLRTDLQRSVTNLTQVRASLLDASSSLIDLTDVSVSFEVWCNAPAASGTGLNSSAHPETCSSFTGSSTNALSAGISDTRIEIDSVVAMIGDLINSINSALGAPGNTGYTGTNRVGAANLVAEAASAVSDGTRISVDVETALRTTRDLLNQCRIGTNPANCP